MHRTSGTQQASQFPADHHTKPFRGTPPRAKIRVPSRIELTRPDRESGRFRFLSFDFLRSATRRASQCHAARLRGSGSVAVWPSPYLEKRGYGSICRELVGPDAISKCLYLPCGIVLAV